MNGESENVLKTIHSTTAVVKAYFTSESSKATCAMLDAVIESYKLELMHVTPDGLIRLQALIQQTQAIRDVVADESQDTPRL